MDPLVFVYGKLRLVADFQLHLAVACLEYNLYVQSFLLLKVQIITLVVESIGLESFHTALVFIGFVDVQLLEFKINTLGIGFLRIVSKLFQAVGKRFNHLSLIQLRQKNAEDIVYIRLYGTRIRICCEDKRYTGMNCFSDFRNINSNFRHFKLLSFKYTTITGKIKGRNYGSFLCFAVECRKCYISHPCYT